MATTRVRVSGLQELGLALQALGNEMAQKVSKQATGAAAGVIKKRAKALAPVADEPYSVEGNERVTVNVGGKRGKLLQRATVLVQPGNIGKQIVTKRVRDTTLTSEHVVAVRGKKQHGYASRIGALQEFGTVKMPPQPFMRPAFEQEKGFAAKAMVDKIAASIRKAGKGAK